MDSNLEESQTPPVAEEIEDDGVAPVVEGADGVAPVVEGADGVAPVVEGADGVAPVVEGADGIAPVIEGADGVAPVAEASTSLQNQYPYYFMGTNGSVGSDMELEPTPPSSKYTDSDTESSMELNEVGNLLTKANDSYSENINNDRSILLNKRKGISTGTHSPRLETLQNLSNDPNNPQPSASSGISQSTAGASLPEWKKTGKDWRLKALLAGAKLHEIGLEEGTAPIGTRSVPLDKSDAPVDETPNVPLDKSNEPLDENLQNVSLDATAMHLEGTGQIAPLKETVSKREISSSEFRTEDCSDITSKEQVTQEKDKLHDASTEQCHEQKEDENSLVALSEDLVALSEDLFVQSKDLVARSKDLAAQIKDLSKTGHGTDASPAKDENIVTDATSTCSATTESSEIHEDSLKLTHKSIKRTHAKTEIDAADATTDESDAKRKKSD